MLSQGGADRSREVELLLTLAEEMFANTGKTYAWLRRPNSVLGGERPIGLLDSEAGHQQVEQLLHKLGHGIAA